MNIIFPWLVAVYSVFIQYLSCAGSVDICIPVNTTSYNPGWIKKVRNRAYPSLAYALLIHSVPYQAVFKGRQLVKNEFAKRLELELLKRPNGNGHCQFSLHPRRAERSNSAWTTGSSSIYIKPVKPLSMTRWGHRVAKRRTILFPLGANSSYHLVEIGSEEKG